MAYKNDLKALVIKSGFTLSRVNDELNRRHGTSLGFQNFSNRLSKESFKYTEICEILDIIGYDIQWTKKDIEN